MQITFLGQSCFYMNFGGKHLVFDPMITANPLSQQINLSSIQSDYVLLTHGHFDHVSDAELLCKQNDATIISNYEVVTWFEQKGIKGHPMNIGGKWNFEFGTLKSVAAVHSSMMPDRSVGGAAGGFVIWNEETSFYVAGDTALTWDMKLIPMTCPSLKFAILPIGDNFTMGYEDAVLAAEFIQCDTIIGCHYDTFGFIQIDHEKAKSEFKNAGKELILLNVGQSIDI